MAKIENKSPNVIDGSFEAVKIGITTSSPGLIMVLVGAVLMMSPNHSKQEISTIDVSTYFERKLTIQSGASKQSNSQASISEKYQVYLNGKRN